MKIQRNLAGLAIVALAALALILGSAPVRSRWAAFAQAPTPQTPSEKIPQKQPLGTASEIAPIDDTPVLETPKSPTDFAVQSAFLEAVNQNRQNILGFVIYDPVVQSIHYSADGSAALVWMALRDPQTGEIVASEPGLSIARNRSGSAPDSAASWSVMFQSEPDFTSQLQSLPADLLTDDIRNRFLQAPVENLTAVQTFTGYKLPWTAGVVKRVTNSIGHYLTVSGGLASCPSTCQYAFDFADGTMFPILAAKGGVVQAAKWTCPNGGSDCTNFLILRDESTIPTTYQVYYHMAYNTLSARLRTPGAAVEQGEFIGNADNTGYSTGHHLHFHVYTTKTSSDYSWGYSVDIAFADVTDNGGRPRTCAEAAEYPNLGAQCQPSNAYVSGNTPRYPPTGTLSSPADRTTVTTNTVRVSGTANDDIGIARIQVLANYDGTWKSIDDVTPALGSWSKDVDLCSANVPDGPFGLAVRIYDVEGSLAQNMPVRQMIKNYACKGGVVVPPPPACTPNDNQVALYADRDFQGACQKFTLNDANGTAYTAAQLGPVGDNNTASVQVGKNVRAVLFDRSQDAGAAVVNGRSETFETSDASLSDNRVGIDMVSGLLVQPRSAGPDEPFFNALIGNGAVPGSSLTSLDSLVISWEGGVGATSFEVKLSGPGANISTTQKSTSLSVGSLTQGDYSLSVRAVNGSGGNTTQKTFTISPASWPAVSALNPPYQESFENGTGGWTVSGLWHYDTISAGSWPTTKAWIFNNGKDYAGSAWKAGDLTSPPIAIPASGNYFLRFAYYADVEDGGPYWDQRWVQISTDGGPFVNLKQMLDDKQAVQSWLNSGAIPLQNVNGKTIRVRFHFDMVDEDYNSGKGWVVDDVSINNQAPASCGAESPEPVALAMNATLSGVICPEGDSDIYKISATAGQPFKVDIDAQSLNPKSELDSIIYLLAEDGASVLAENDDEVYDEIRDSLLAYTPTRTGNYYVKVKPWDFPGAGGPDHFYNISLKPQSGGQVPRSVSILYPYDHNTISSMPFEISASAQDYDGGPVAQVDFFWHGGDWSQPNWTKVGTDKNPADGWTVIIDPLRYGAINGGALYVQATGQTGGVKGTVMWDLHVDDTRPVTQLSTLPATTQSTAFQLSWNGIDVHGDIDHYNLQYQVNGGSWMEWQAPSFPANVHSVWVFGKPGETYGFRIRAVDRQGNVEDFSANAQEVTTIENTCTPDSSEVTGQTLMNATPLPFGGVSGVYNFCKSSSAGAGAGDEDWFSFTAQAGQRLTLMSFSRGIGTDVSVSLVNASGGMVGVWSAVDLNQPVTARFTVPASGTYYLKVSSVNGSIYGTDVKYQMWLGVGKTVFMPLMNR